MADATERHRLRTTFDEVPEIYERARTPYPPPLFDDLVASGLTMCVITHDHDVATHAHRQVRIVDGRLTEVEMHSAGAPR